MIATMERQLSFDPSQFLLGVDSQAERLEILYDKYREIEADIPVKQQQIETIGKYYLGGILDAIATELKEEGEFERWVKSRWNGGYTTQYQLREAFCYINNYFGGPQIFQANPNIGISAIYLLSAKQYASNEEIHNSVKNKIALGESLQKKDALAIIKKFKYGIEADPVSSVEQIVETQSGEAASIPQDVLATPAEVNPTYANGEDGNRNTFLDSLDEIPQPVLPEHNDTDFEFERSLSSCPAPPSNKRKPLRDDEVVTVSIPYAQWQQIVESARKAGQTPLTNLEEYLSALHGQIEALQAEVERLQNAGSSYYEEFADVA